MRPEQRPVPQPEQGAGMSRRRMIITGAGIAAAGVVAGAAVAVPLTVAEESPDTVDAGKVDKPIMVHMRHLETGEFDAFYGTKIVRFTDRAFAAHLVNAVTAG